MFRDGLGEELVPENLMRLSRRLRIIRSVLLAALSDFGPNLVKNS